MGLLNWLFSRKSAATKNSNGGLPDRSNDLIDISKHIDTSEGFVDILLTIRNYSVSTTSHIYTVQGRYKNQVVGLRVEIKNGIEAGISETGEINPIAVVANGVCISSLGQESDEFVKALSKLYRLPSRKQFTSHPINLTVFSLNTINADLGKAELYKFKLFIEENSDSLYAEVYLNIDLTNNTLELAEKDMSYRENIIKAMTKL